MTIMKSDDPIAKEYADTGYTWGYISGRESCILWAEDEEGNSYMSQKVPIEEMNNTLLSLLSLIKKGEANQFLVKTKEQPFN